MAQIYNSKKITLSSAQLAEFKTGQINWLKQLDIDCQNGDRECLRENLRKRITELNTQSPGIKTKFDCSKLLTPEYFNKVTNYAKEIKSSSLSPDGRFELRVKDDGSVALKTLNNGNVRDIFTLTGTSMERCGSIGCVGEQAAIFSKTGDFAVTSSSFLNGPVLVWDTKNWSQIIELPGDYFCISNSGKYIALCSHSWNTGWTLSLYNLSSRKNTILSTSNPESGATSAEKGISLIEGESITKWFEGGIHNFGFSENDDALIVEVGYKEYAIINPSNFFVDLCPSFIDACNSSESNLVKLKIEAIDEYNNMTMNGKTSLKAYCDIRNAIASANYAELAKRINYPIISSINGKETRVYSAQQFVDFGSQIITSAIRKAVLETSFIDVFLHPKGSMVMGGHVWFSSNGILSIDHKDNQIAPKSASPLYIGPQARYIDHKDGTVTDSVTGLMWMRCAIGQSWTGITCEGKAKEVPWEDAIKYSIKFAGYYDWILPNIDELSTIVYCSNGKPDYFSNGKNASVETGDWGCYGKPGKDHFRPTIAQDVFPSCPSSLFWSSSRGDQFPSGIFFGYGSVSSSNSTDVTHIRMVRKDAKVDCGYSERSIKATSVKNDDVTMQKTPDSTTPVAQKAPDKITTVPPPSLKITDSFRTKKYDIQIVDVSALRSVGGDSLFGTSTAAEGAMYIAVRFKYKNISTKPIGMFSSKPDIKLKSPDGTKYNSDNGASVAYAAQLNLDEKVFSDLNPGITVNSSTVFEVSQELFNPATWKVLIEADDNTEMAFQ
jgi:hypothetical protein